MAYVCRNCALQAHRLATATTREVQRRTFSQSTTRARHGGVPSFAESSSPELNDTLLTLRDKHFFPAYLSNRQKNLIHKDKYITELENNPATVTLGDEDFQLEHVDRLRDIPARGPIVRKAIELMNENQEWSHLPAVLEGLHTAKATPTIGVQEKIIRQAARAGQISFVMASLSRPNVTGLSLKRDEIVHAVLRGIRQQAANSEWSKKGVEKALGQLKQFAQLLEQDGHVRGKSTHQIAKNDPRTNPVVIGAFLEMYAINAYRHQDKADTDGSVRKYSERLVTCMGVGIPSPQASDNKNAHVEFFTRFPVHNGLRLAKDILRKDVSSASNAVQQNQARLAELVQTFEGQDNAEGSYAQQALNDWAEAKSA